MGRPAQWTNFNRTPSFLGSLGGDGGEGRDVSADGRVIVGWALNEQEFPRAFRWENGVMQYLGVLPGYETASFADAVSADGRVVVGLSWDDQGVQQAFRWENGVMQPLGDLGGGRSAATAVSSDGRVVIGWSWNANRQSRIFRWENGVMRALGTAAGYIHFYAEDATPNCDVLAGTMWSVQNFARAFRWRNDTFEPLPGLPGYFQSHAYGISADGAIVVGMVINHIGIMNATIWDARGRAISLNQAYAHLLQEYDWLYEAIDISPDGRYIVGWGYNSATNSYEGFLLDTVPEPASSMMLGIGLLCWVGQRIRHKRYKPHRL